MFARMDGGDEQAR
jgi:hypothetical protein